MTLKLWNRPFLPSFFEDDFKLEDKEFFSPKANIIENEKSYLIDLELPGVKKEEVDIIVKDGLLSVRGEKKKQVKEKEENYSFFESYFGSFERSWRLDNVEQGKIAADFKDGVLKLTLPKKEEVIEKEKVKKITIQ